MAKTTRQADQSSWDIWEEALNKCFGGHLEPERLLHPLGMWKASAKGQWEWMVSIDSATLFKKIPNRWQPHCITRGGVCPGSIFKQQGCRVNTLPPGNRPTDISTTGLRRGQVKVNTYSTDGCEAEEMEEHLTLQALLDALPEPSKWAVEEIKQFGNCEDEGKDVAEAVVLGKCRAVTDGTHKLQEGAASFAVHGTTSRHQLMGSNRTPGRRDEITPYQAELGGVVGILVLLTVLCQLHHITTGKVELGLDCEAAIKALTAVKDPKISTVDYDLVMEGRRLVASLPIEVKWRWIKGHQDKIAGQHLDWWALQNIRMDKKAKDMEKRTKAMHWAHFV